MGPDVLATAKEREEKKENAPQHRVFSYTVYRTETSEAAVARGWLPVLLPAKTNFRSKDARGSPQSRRAGGQGHNHKQTPSRSRSGSPNSRALAAEWQSPPLCRTGNPHYEACPTYLLPVPTRVAETQRVGFFISFPLVSRASYPRVTDTLSTRYLRPFAALTTTRGEALSDVRQNQTSPRCDGELLVAVEPNYPLTMGPSWALFDSVARVVMGEIAARKSKYLPKRSHSPANC